MAETLVRAATAKDVDAIVQLQRLIHAEHLAGDRLRWATAVEPASVYPAWLASLVADDHGGVCLVALADEAVVGYLIAEFEPESARHWSPAAVYLHDVFVLPTHRRLGLARRLMETVLRWRDARDHRLPVRLITAARNEAARAFFGQFGFRPAAVEMIEDATNANAG